MYVVPARQFQELDRDGSGVVSTLELEQWVLDRGQNHLKMSEVSTLVRARYRQLSGAPVARACGGGGAGGCVPCGPSADIRCATRAQVRGMDPDGSGALQLQSFERWWSAHPREFARLFGASIAPAATPTVANPDLSPSRQQRATPGTEVAHQEAFDR